MASSICHTNYEYQEIYHKMWMESHKGTYVSYLRGKRCQTDKALFDEISASFQFPPYFGENWNALHDCLRDLGWLKISRIFIAMDDYSLAYPDDPEGKELLMRSFENMIEYWQSQKVDVEIWLNH